MFLVTAVPRRGLKPCYDPTDICSLFVFTAFRCSVWFSANCNLAEFNDENQVLPYFLSYRTNPSLCKSGNECPPPLIFSPKAHFRSCTQTSDIFLLSLIKVTSGSEYLILLSDLLSSNTNLIFAFIIFFSLILISEKNKGINLLCFGKIR